MAVFDSFTGIGVASGFKLQAKTPLDARQVVNTIADRDLLIAENGAYEGMLVYVKETQTLYQLTGETVADWVEVGSGIVTEDDLDDALKEKVNAASEGNHSHLNKAVLDSITTEKTEAWDGKPDVYIQADQPEGMKENDLWVQIIQ